MDRNRQQVYARPPGAPFMPMPGAMVALPPEMAQGMPPTMMMAGPYGPYPGMMMQTGPMMQMPAPPMGMSPQLTQMLAQSAQGGRGSNVFFKTRLCNKWRSGTCPFGDKCTYAHGQHELRYIPPELLAQLEREQRAQEQAQRAAVPPPPPGAPPAPGDAPAGPGGAMGEDPAAADARSKPQLYYKTRLCIRFMQTGFCSKGAACTFAHGYEDLRLLGHDSGAAGPGPRGTPPRSGGGGRSGGRQALPPRTSPVVSRARALSAMAGVGDAGCDVSPAEAAEAAEALRSGEALRATAYADSAQDFADVPPQ